MPNVTGLRPSQGNQPEVRQKKGRLAVQRGSSQGVALRPSAAPVDSYVSVGPTPDVSSDTQRLASALAQLNPAIGQVAAIHQRATEQDQLVKLRYYTEQFMKDKQTGAVNATQVKEMFPELVPTVAARIAQATGEVEARRWVQDQIQTILESDDIRLNTQNRHAALEAIREEARGLIGDNEFYGTGFLTQLDSSLREFETSWMRETAAHQEALQMESFGNHVADVLLNGGDLLELDAQWKESSSLNNLERNAVVVNTAVAQAVATGNEALLDRVPERFLNAETKAQLLDAKDKIQQSRYTQRVRQRQMQQWAREDSIRNGKIDILRRISEGDELNPSEFYHTPELFEYAMRLNSEPVLNETVSIRNAENLRSTILRASTAGGYMEAFKDDPSFAMTFADEDEVSEEGLRDYIMNRNDLNPAQKQALITEVPTLMEGVSFVRNPDFDTHFENTLGNDLKVFGQSVPGQALQTMGVNVQGAVQNAYRDRLRNEVIAHIEENGEVPRGTVKLEIMQRAEEAANRRLQYFQQNYQSLMQESAQQMTGRSEASRATAPQRAAPEPSNTGDDNTIVLPNGVRVQRVE